MVLLERHAHLGNLSSRISTLPVQFLVGSRCPPTAFLAHPQALLARAHLLLLLVRRHFQLLLPKTVHALDRRPDAAGHLPIACYDSTTTRVAKDTPLEERGSSLGLRQPQIPFLC